MSRSFQGSGLVGIMIILLIGAWGGLSTATPLDDYVATPDPAYTYHLDNTIPGAGITTYVYYMASQNWRTAPTEVDRSLWEHRVRITVPATVTHDTAFLVIGGGSSSSAPPSGPDSTLAYFATYTNTIVADLNRIPDQPLHFPDEADPDFMTTGRYEDDIIAYGWDKFMKTGDATWLPRLPMTKAVVRAMDTIQAEFPSVHKFFVAGGSKRGWTTWTTAAVDDRVTAIAPLVIDVLNGEASIQHHWDVYGFWAPALDAYTRMGIMEHIHTPEFRELLAIVDPYSYRDRLTMPKLVGNSTGDQFFVSDSSQFYFHDLSGEKYLRYVPNTDHDGNASAWYDILAYYNAFLDGVNRPELTWSQRPNGAVEIHTNAAPSDVLLWQATNPAARDFRLMTIGSAWTSSPLAPESPGVYVAQVPEPPAGWTAFMVEFTFPSGGTYPFRFTTDVFVAPDQIPYGDSDHDGATDLAEGREDLDADQQPNYKDIDSDGDGVDDRSEREIWGTDPYSAADIPDLPAPVWALGVILIGTGVCVAKRGYTHRNENCERHQKRIS